MGKRPRRGRPRKSPPPTQSATAKRGRPRKSDAAPRPAQRAAASSLSAPRRITRSQGKVPPLECSPKELLAEPDPPKRNRWTASNVPGPPGGYSLRQSVLVPDKYSPDDDETSSDE